MLFNNPNNIVYPNTTAVELNAKKKPTDTWMQDYTLDQRKLKFFEFCDKFDMREDDLLKVLDPKSGRVICEGQVDKIPLKISSSTQDGHFSQDTSNWKNYFTKKYTADVIKEIKTTTNNT
mgnify:CR=1 FL=1